MRISKILLVVGAIAANPFITAEGADTVPESCTKLVAALEACEKGPEGPFGSVRKTCKASASSEYKCDIPLDEVKKLINQ